MNEREATAASAGTTGTIDTQATAAKPGTPAETTAVQTETQKQAKLFDTLNTAIEKGWTDIENTGMIHYKALADMAMDKAQAELDYMAQCVNLPAITRSCRT